jgi:DNA-binding LacI/PurR family transcriptional regulator
MAPRVTSAEVARLAGVSQSAVSRAFTPGASVSPRTVEKVRAAAASLGYRPNVLARAMITGGVASWASSWPTSTTSSTPSRSSA